MQHFATQRLASSLLCCTGSLRAIAAARTGLLRELRRLWLPRDRGICRFSMRFQTI